MVRSKYYKPYSELSEKQKEQKRAYNREWRKNNLHDVRISQIKYYYKHREEILAYQREYRKNHPEYTDRANKRNKERFRTDPEFRQRMYANQKKWRDKNKGKYHRISKFITGLLCGNCDRGIITNTGGRLGKRPIKCPHCGFYEQKKNLQKIRIERNIPNLP